jgi:hypothetical protein
MGLKCSLLGCEYGPVETERERTQRGGEVVETVREVRRCERCGDPQVVTENKEITTVETPSEDDGAPAAPETAQNESGGTASPDASGGGTGSSTGSLSGVGEEWESAPRDPDAAEHIEDAEGESAGTTDEIPQDDDAVIITDSGEEETPEPTAGAEDDASAAGSPPESNTDGFQGSLDSEPSTSPPAADDSTPASGSSADAAAPAGSDAGPSVAEGEEDEVEVFGADGVDTVDTGDPDPTATSSESSSTDDGEADRSDGAEVVTGGAASAPEDVEYYCPDCGHTEDAIDASLRAGDLCPECLGAYVEERPTG